MTGERQAARTLWVAVVSLVDQAVDVGGQNGRCGADGVVPQDVDHVVQSVQSVLHLRLWGTPGQRSRGGLGKKVELYVCSPPEQLSASQLLARMYCWKFHKFRRGVGG